MTLPHLLFNSEMTFYRDQSLKVWYLFTHFQSTFFLFFPMKISTKAVLIWPILENRAEILQMILLLFGKLKMPQFPSEIWPLVAKFISSEKTTKFCKIFTLSSLALHRTKVKWRFRKILRPSQNIWTLQWSLLMQIFLCCW